MDRTARFLLVGGYLVAFVYLAIPIAEGHVPLRQYAVLAAIVVTIGVLLLERPRAVVLVLGVVNALAGAVVLGAAIFQAATLGFSPGWHDWVPGLLYFGVLVPLTAGITLIRRARSGNA